MTTETIILLLDIVKIYLTIIASLYSSQNANLLNECSSQQMATIHLSSLVVLVVFLCCKQKE